jgi:hypothetical protein
MIKKLELIEIELYCIHVPITDQDDRILTNKRVERLILSSICVENKKWNIPIQEFNF